MNGISVLSLFDGMSCGQIALRELGVPIAHYYASEIDKYAIAQTQLNFPDTIQLGSVTEVHAKDLPKIDLLIGGSPCQGFSFAGKQLNFNDPRSKLFFEFVRLLKECREINPDVKFLLENVRMKREYQNIISEMLGVEPVIINSALVSAQNRVRLYWSNIRTTKSGLFGLKTDIPQPQDRGLLFKDIMESDVPELFYLKDEYIQKLIKHKERNKENGNGFGMTARSLTDKSVAITVEGRAIYDLISIPIIMNNDIIPGTLRTHKVDGGFRPMKSGKAGALCARARQDGSGQGVLKIDERIRRYTPKECARLQTIPEWYRWGCSDPQAYKMLGNGWTVEVIKHIFSFMFEENQPENERQQSNQPSLFDLE